MHEQGHEFSREFQTRFHPEHLADLACSGLTEATITTLEIHTIRPCDITRHLGFHDPRITSVLCFPYPGLNGFCRDKLFPPLPDANGHARRYHQRKGSGVHAYMPPAVQHALTQPGHRIIITEGEKKAAKACQEDLPTIGLGGVWNWGRQGELIRELRETPWTEHPVLLVPDSDVWQRNDLLCAVYACGRTLERYGAKVAVLHLPPDGAEKIGFDDFLVHHSAATLETIEQVPLDHPLFAAAARWEPRWRRKHMKAHAPPLTSSLTSPQFTPPAPATDLPRFPQEAWTEPFLRWREILSRHTNAPDEFLWATFATAWGLVLGRRVFVCNPRKIYPNLWTLLIGPSALARKSTVLYALKLLLQTLTIPYLPVSGLSSIEGLAQQIADDKEPITLLFEEEFRRLLGVAARKVTANLIPDLQRLSYCDHSFDLTRKDRLHIEQPFLAIITATPLNYIEDLLTEDLFSGGFLNRFLPLHGEPNAPIARPPALTTFALAPVTAYLRDRMTAIPSPDTELSLTTEADEAFAAWHTPWYNGLRPLPDHLQAVLVRLPEHTLKLSLLYATLAGARVITSDHLTPALAVIQYVQILTLHLFRGVSLSRTARIEERVYQCIAQGKMTASAIKQHLGGRVSTDEINKALDTLIKADRIVKAQATTSKNRAFFTYTLPSD